MTCTKRFLKRIWDAYLVHIYLHEVGHVKYIAKNGQFGSENLHEDKAEEFAWHVDLDGEAVRQGDRAGGVGVVLDGGGGVDLIQYMVMVPTMVLYGSSATSS